MRLSDAPLIDANAIAARVDALAAELRGHYADTEITAVVVLKGAAWFAADLLRLLPQETVVEFLRVKSYAGTQRGGPPQFHMLPEDLAGRHVLIVEDILDTGHTLQAVLAHVADAGPASLRSCVLLDKPARRELAVEADFRGFVIDDHFVVGYGLDYEERYRTLPAIYRLLPE